MDKVSETGAIPGIPVRPKDLDFRAPSKGGVDNQRQNVLLRGVVFTETSLCIRACSIEVTQRNRLQAKCMVIVAENPLEHQLCFAVGVGRLLWMVFWNRQNLWLAVGRGRA